MPITAVVVHMRDFNTWLITKKEYKKKPEVKIIQVSNICRQTADGDHCSVGGGQFMILFLTLKSKI